MDRGVFFECGIRELKLSSLLYMTTFIPIYITRWKANFKLIY